MERGGGVAAIVGDTRENTVQQGSCNRCLAIEEGISVGSPRPSTEPKTRKVKKNLKKQGRKININTKFWPEFPADIPDPYARMPCVNRGRFPPPTPKSVLFSL